jgi:hypothetical protein
MDLLQLINSLVLVIGIPAIAVALITMGKRLHTLEVLENTVGKIKTNVKVIADYLTRNHSTFNAGEIQAYSPLKLTPLGEEFIKEIGFDKVFEEHKQEFFTFIDQEHPKFKYDVETGSVKSIYIFSDKEWMSFLKVFFYNNPTRTMENTAPTLGIYVRDAYLLMHPEIVE